MSYGDGRGGDGVVKQVTPTPRKNSDRDLINAFAKARKALVVRMQTLLRQAEEEEELGEIAEMEAQGRAKALKERAGQIELTLSQSTED
jgi:predicted membrane chloride channel (bestrophin family)